MDDQPDCEADVDLTLLRESAREFLTERTERDSLKVLAAMDWTGLLVEEELGGAGWRPVETTVIAEELGRAHDCSPWFGSVLAAAALSSAPSAQRDAWLPALLGGTAKAGLAIADDTVRIVGGDDLDLIVTLGRNGIHLIDSDETTEKSLDADLLDVTRPVWCIDLSGASKALIGSPKRADRLLAVAKVLIAADSLGALAATFERLVAYLKTRIAFGVPIASFQAVQHRLVDLLVLEVKARAVIMKAARLLASADITDRSIALAAAAHAFVTSKATAAVDECMQLSGGIGFTWEYPLHHDLRRVFTNGYLLGTARSSRAAVAEKASW